MVPPRGWDVSEVNFTCNKYSLYYVECSDAWAGWIFSRKSLFPIPYATGWAQQDLYYSNSVMLADASLLLKTGVLQASGFLSKSLTKHCFLGDSRDTLISSLLSFWLAQECYTSNIFLLRGPREIPWLRRNATRSVWYTTRFKNPIPHEIYRVEPFQVKYILRVTSILAYSTK